MSIVSELNIFTDLENEHCTLEFDLGDNVISGEEIIVTDDFIVNCSNRDFTNLEYYLKLNYYYIPADVDGSRTGEIPIEKLIKLDEGNNTISFTDYPIYLSGDCQLIINKIDESGYGQESSTNTIKLTTSQSSIFTSETIKLTAKVLHNGLPVTSGTVTFKDGNTTLGTATTDSDGIATFLTDDLTTSGTHRLTAVYSTDSSRERIVEVTQATNVMVLQMWGSSFRSRSNPFGYSGDLLVSWGDGTRESYTGSLNHTYANSGNHTIRVFGDIYNINQGAFNANLNLTGVILSDSVETIDFGAFRVCTNLSSINIPSAVYYINSNVFESCSSLTSIILNWTDSNKINWYKSSWILNANSNLKFSIPNGKTSLYTAKDYPSGKLVERS